MPMKIATVSSSLYGRTAIFPVSFSRQHLERHFTQCHICTVALSFVTTSEDVPYSPAYILR